MTDSMAAKQKTLGRPLTWPEKGETLTETFRKELGPAPSVGKAKTPKKPMKEAVKDKKKLKQIYTDAAQFVGKRLMKEVLKKEMPNFVTTTSGGGHFLRLVNKIQFNQNKPGQLQHEFGHHLGTLGRNHEAEDIFRRKFTTGTKIVDLPGGGTGKTGVWGDQYCGRRYPGNSATEVISVVMGQLLPASGRGTTASRFKVTNTEVLANLWEANPEHLGFALTYLQGSFI